MKYFFASLIYFLFNVALYSQTYKLPVQGKMFFENKPITGTRLLKFSIDSIRWSQTFSDVQITDGLYSVDLDVPSDLFLKNRSQELKIEVNGTILNRFKIHSPIESDPTLPIYLKDGISWNEIENIPKNLDVDTTNELQILKLEGNVLSISKGNSVSINSGSFDSGDSLVVGKVKSVKSISAQSSTTGGSITKSTSTLRQYFVSNCTCKLISIDIELANIDQLGSEIRFYQDTTDTQALFINSFKANSFSATNNYQSFYPPNSGIELKANKTYVFQISVIGGDYVFKAKTQGYPFGDSNLGENLDVNFRINVESIVGPFLKVDTLGKVGIGTNSPTSALSVNGRIEDKTGVIMPVGTIISWAGISANPPKGWLICNGESISRATYADLFEVVSENWGAGDGKTTFNLPDLRGEFLRGWDGNSGNDPDANTRVNKYPGGKKGNFVGTYQDDMFEKHEHNYSLGGYWIGRGSNNTSGYRAADVDLIQRVTGSKGGAETRSRNASVLYIIKF
jgi:hypothetical protein